MGKRKRELSTILRVTFRITLAFIVCATSLRWSYQPVQAAGFIQEWQTADLFGYTGLRVMVQSDSLDPLPPIIGPGFREDISRIFVLEADGTPIMDFNLAREIVFLVQNRQLAMELIGDDGNYAVKGLDVKRWGPFTDNYSTDFELYLTPAAKDIYVNWVLKSRLEDRVKRVELYQQLIQSAIFAELHLDDETRATIEFMEDFESDFQRAIDNAAGVVGTAGWAGDVMGLFDGYLDLRDDVSPVFKSHFSTFSTGVSIAFTLVSWTQIISEAQLRTVVMHGWVQSIFAERLKALEDWLDAPNVTVDPAVEDAVDFIRADFNTLTAGNIQSTFENIFDQINLGEEIFNFVGIGLALAKVAPPWSVWFTIAFIGVKGWNWLMDRDDQVMSTGLAATLCEQLSLELIYDYSRLQNEDELKMLLQLHNIRIYLGYYFYNVLVERSEGYDEFFHLFSQSYDDWQADLAVKRDIRLTEFLNSRPPSLMVRPNQEWFWERISIAWPVTLTNPSVTPPSGSSALADEWTFRVEYVSMADTAPDYVRLELDGVDHDMDQVDPGDSTYTDGALFEYVSGPLTPSTYPYLYKASDGAMEGATGSMNLLVTDPQASGVTLVSDMSIVPVDGVTQATLTVTVTDGQGRPIPDQTVNFSANGHPSIFTRYSGTGPADEAVTDGSGQARVYWRPTSVTQSGQTATLSAEAENEMTAEVQIECTGSTDVDLRTRLNRIADLTYEMLVNVHYISTGEILQFEPVTLTTDTGTLTACGDPGISGTEIVLITNSAAAGGIPGEVCAKLDLPGEGEVTLSATARSVTEYTSSYLGGQPPSITPFLTMGGDTWGVDWAPDGGLVATSGDSEQVRFWEPTTGIFDHGWYPAGGGEGTAYALSYAPDSQDIAVAARDGYKIRVSDGYLHWERPVLASPQAVDWSPNGSWIAAGSDDETVVWTSGGTVALTISHTDDRARTVAFSPDSQYLLVGHEMGDLEIFNTSSWSLHQSFPTDPDGDTNDDVWAATWSLDGTKYVLATEELGIQLYNFGETTPYAAYTGHAFTNAYALDWCKDSDSNSPGYGKVASVAMVAASDFRIHVWDGETLQAHVQVPLTAVSRGLSWSPDCTLLAYANGIVSPWDTLGPDIDVTSHYNGQILVDSLIMLEGSILDDTGVAQATLTNNANPPLSLSLSGEGVFSQALALEPGDNQITISATDGTGNSNDLVLTIVRLTDQTGPAINDISVSPLSAESCDPFTITAAIDDAWSGVDDSTPQAHIQLTDGVDVGTAPLVDDGSGGDVLADDGVYTATWDSCPAVVEGMYLLDIEAGDLDGNGTYADNTTLFEIFNVPQISDIQVNPALPNNSQPVEISAILTDEAGIGGAVLYYSLDLGANYLAVPMSYDPGSGRYIGMVPAQDQGDVWYRVDAWDLIGHSSTSGVMTYPVVDGTPPSFAAWTSAPVPLRTDWSGALHVEVDVVDSGGSGMGPAPPELSYKRGDADLSYSVYAPMTSLGADRWSFDIPEPSCAWGTMEGDVITWVVQAADLVGNSGESAIRSVTVLDDDETGPEIEPPDYPRAVVSSQPMIVQAVVSDAAMGDSGVSAVTLYYGETYPYDTTSVVGVGPGGNGDGTWTFTLPPFGESFEGTRFKFYLVAQDGDDTPAESVENASGAYYIFTVISGKIYLPLIVR
jgi:WD40 repeat protein